MMLKIKTIFRFSGKNHGSSNFVFQSPEKNFSSSKKKVEKKVFSFFIGPTRAGGERNWTSGKGHLPEFKRPQTIYFLTRLCENDEQFKAHRFYDSLCGIFQLLPVTKGQVWWFLVTPVVHCDNRSLTGNIGQRPFVNLKTDDGRWLLRRNAQSEMTGYF